MSQATKPAFVSQNGDEDKTWGVNVGSQLTGTQLATLPVARLAKDGVLITLTDAPLIGSSGPGLADIVTQRIRAGVLTPGTYELRALFTPSGTTNVLEQVLKIVCRRAVTP